MNSRRFHPSDEMKKRLLRKHMILGILLFAGLLVGTASGQSKNELLFTAVKAGNKTTAERLIAEGADVNAKDKRDKTALHCAISKDVAELLIAKGADMNAKDDTGWTPLHDAVFSGHKDVVELLIAKGADVNAKGYGNCLAG
jgi:cytohesin